MNNNGGVNKSAYFPNQEYSNLETINKNSEVVVQLSKDYHYTFKNDEEYKKSKISKF